MVPPARSPGAPSPEPPRGAEPGRQRTVLIDPDIRVARTLPGWVYTDERVHRRLLEGAFAGSWQPLPPEAAEVPRGGAVPFEFLPGILPEPLVATRDETGTLRVLSNVCTHRGHLVVGEACAASALRCRYHGRTFGLDGRMASAPGFEGARDFPGPSDDLPSLPTVRWGPLVLAALPGAPPLPDGPASAAGHVARASGVDARHDPVRSRDYAVDASWIAYVDNYLEGFHIPFVHKGLNQTLDWDAYRVETFPGGVLQVGRARPGEPAFPSAPAAPRDDERVAAYYLWLWPNLMLNVYPWGLSLNVVEPHGPTKTRVRFRTYVRDAALLDRGAGAGLDRVEHEDEEVVAAVQRGLGSRLYERGRYAPAHEQGVHAFHRRIAEALATP
jgi:choline monooxygenase